MQSESTETQDTGADQPTLRLHYILTPAEREAAKTLVFRQQMGGGSKWVTRFVALLILGGLLLRAWSQIMDNEPGNGRFVWVGILLLVWLVVFLMMRRAKRQPAANLIAEISSIGLHFGSTTGQALMLWGSFSRRLESDSLFVLLDRNQRLAYIIPKRAIPSEPWIEWVRQVCGAAGEALPLPPKTSDPAANADADAIRFQCQLRFRDMIALTLSSSLYRVMVLGWTTLHLALFAFGTIHPMPDATESPTSMFLKAQLPFIIGFPILLLLVFSIRGWLLSVQRRFAHTFELTETSLRTHYVGGTAIVPLDLQLRYKELGRGFHLWRGLRGGSIYLPKRAFPSPAAIDRARQIFQSRLKRSIWYFA